MEPGTLIHDPNFRFRDGQLGNKILIVLSDGSDGTYLSVKTTSNGTRYSNQYGCQLGSRFPHFFLPPKSCCLEKPTWVCLDEFYELTVPELETKILDGHIRRIGVLPGNVRKEVISCATNSEDISAYQAGHLLSIWKKL